MTKRQADLMAARRIIPIRVMELQLDRDEVLRRGMNEKMKPNRSESELSLLHLYRVVCSICCNMGLNACIINELDSN